MHDHRQLRAFQLADQLVFMVYEATRHFPEEEKFGLTSQLRRAALSVPSNLVEGCARDSDKELQRFAHISLGSLKEVEYQLSVAARLRYLPDHVSTQLEEHLEESGRVLYGFIRKVSVQSS